MSRSVIDDHPDESAALCRDAYRLGALHMLIWLAAWFAWAEDLSKK